MIVPSDPRYRHLRDMLMEMHQRYQRPIFIAETGIEDETRPAWLRYISNEAAGGVPDYQAIDTSALDWAAHSMEDRTDESRSVE